MRKIGKDFIYMWLIGTLSALSLLTVTACIFHSNAFSLDKIRPTRDFSFQSTSNSSQKELDILQKIASQPFHYLTEGEESYLFLSEDKEYVLKFFKMRKLTPKYWLNYIPIPWLDKKRLSKIDVRERLRHEVFGGLKIGFQKFRHQTGIIFLHLFRTSYLKSKVRVYDQEGRAHDIPLDTVPFLVQKKVSMLPEYILSLVEQNREKEAARALCRVLEMIKDTCERGSFHINKCLETDYGFLDGKPVYIESIYAEIDPLKGGQHEVLSEVLSISRSMKSWIMQHHPQIAAAFDREMQSLFSSLEEE